MQIPWKSRVFSDRKIAGRRAKKVCTLQNDWKPRKPSPHLVGNREQNSAFSFLPRTSSRGCIFSLLPRTVRRAVNGDTWMGILAAHTAENELRTFSIVLLKENYFLLLWTMRSIDRPVSGRVQPWPILLTPQIMCLILFWPLLNVSFTSSTGAENINIIRFFRSFPSSTGRLWDDPGLSK